MISTLLLNRYELLEKIGEGGMGIVYKAKCHLLNRFVAVKILKSELNNYEDFVAKFRREANSVASLSHQNIVNVYDIGSENNINFIVMEYINGKTLKQVINQNVKLSPRKALEISLQIAKALECAHKNNIIHRDIKPDNILITEDNIVKVADFGIAKVVDSSTLTNSKNVIGSVHYFSPEQAKGRSVDCRTDIYSLGIVMYEMVTGQVPYNAESSISVAIMHINEPVIPPKEVITDIPEDINNSILKALEKEPINRYQTAKEMVSILNAIKEDFDLKLKLYNRSMETTMVMMTEPLVVSDTEHDFTTVMSQVAVPENPLIKKDRKVPSKDKGINNNKKRMIIVGSIILLMIIGIFGEYLSNRPSTAIAAPIAKTTAPEASMKLPADEKKLVPSLIGKAQDIAENTIVNNGFLIGNISSDYSDSIAKGLIISQSPVVNTSYEKNGKIDFVISQGQKVVQVTPQLRGNNKKEEKDKKVKTIDEALIHLISYKQNNSRQHLH